MKRDIPALKAAHIMDSERRELYVEGRRDRLFFTSVAGCDCSSNTSIHEIDNIDIGSALDNCNRAKLITFAGLLRSENLHIRCFADADFDRLLNVTPPENTWLTDCRDLEGYFLQPESIHRLLTQGLAIESLKADDLIASVYRLGRPVGVLRFLSHRDDLKLPFKDRPLKPYLKRRQNVTQLEFDSYLQALMQGAGIKLTRLKEIKALHDDLTAELTGTDNEQLLHGKDSIQILGHLLKDHALDENSVEPSLWMSVDKASLGRFGNLSAAINFLKRQSTSM